MEFSVLVPNEFLFGKGILESLHSYDDTLGPLLQMVSHFWHYLGSNLFFMGILAVTYVLYSPRLGSLLAIGLLSSGVTNGLLKFAFKSPRPTGLDPQMFPLVDQLGEFAFGFPSGHCQSSVVVWGLLYAFIPHPILRTISVLVIVFMPFARMYLGVHYLGDTIGGLAMGFLNLWAVLWFANSKKEFPILPSIQERPRLARTYSLLVLALSLSPILLIEEGLSQPEFHSLVSVLVASSAFCGALVGIYLINTKLFNMDFSWGPFYEGSQYPTLIFFVRILSLMGAIVVFYLIPQAFFKKIGYGEDILVKYIRYLLISFVLIYLLPLFLKKWKGGMFLKSM